MQFEWDTHKALLNLRKHKVSFEEAATALRDTMAGEQALTQTIQWVSLDTLPLVFQNV